MARLAEYGTFQDSERSIKTVLAEGMGAFGRKYTLLHATAGYEPAGSVARYTEEYWSVTFFFDNAIHGRRYAKEQSARDDFAAHTTPIVEIKA